MLFTCVIRVNIAVTLLVWQTRWLTPPPRSAPRTSCPSVAADCARTRRSYQVSLPGCGRFPFASSSLNGAWELSSASRPNGRLLRSLIRCPRCLQQLKGLLSLSSCRPLFRFEGTPLLLGCSPGRFFRWLSYRSCRAACLVMCDEACCPQS